MTDEPTDLLANVVALALAGDGVEIASIDLEDAISEVTIETTINVAPTLTVTVIDPLWTTQASGLLDVSDSGLLPVIALEFPPNSGMHWQLCTVQGSTETGQPNLILTFENRIVSFLRKKWGPLIAGSGTTTRAQFIKRLVDGANADITFVCPELNVIQPIAAA